MAHQLSSYQNGRLGLSREMRAEFQGCGDFVGQRARAGRHYANTC